ncbi:MAG: hypothetical protein ACE5NM_09175 [Sedimentisphaerales bacterium]
MNKKNFGLSGLLLPVLVLILGLTTITGGKLNSNPVNWAKFKIFTERWLNTRGPSNGLRSYAKLSHSRRVDFVDFALWAQNWSTQKVYTIAYDPYQDVNWAWWYRALAQHHDHVGRLSLDRIKAYDEAGYNVIVPLDYAGKKSGGTAYCDYRLWPVHEYLGGFNSDQEVLATLHNIRLFIPSMEEIGCHHITSPFLTTYIELWEPDYYETKQQWQYETSQQCIDLINQYGAMAIIAHPTENIDYYMQLQNYKGIEIVNAHYYRLWLLGLSALNYNEHFQALWDTVLTHKDTKIWGFAVNDWWGPWNDSEEAFIDSGKIMVMLPAYNIDDYRNSLEKGCFFAIHDRGQPKQNKGRYPMVAAIISGDHSITIYTDGMVSWIANGQRIAEGDSINLMEFPPEAGYKYVRAEISNAYGTVFTQPWTLALLP